MFAGGDFPGGGVGEKAADELSVKGVAGFAGFDMSQWQGVLAPAGTSRAIVARLNLEIVKAMRAADVHERLVLYKRFANCDRAERVEAMQEELVDRFGDLPPAARALIESHRLRILGRALGVARVDAAPEFIQLQFVPHPPLDPAAVLKLVQKQRGWKLTAPNKLRVERVTSELPERALAVRQVLETLSS